jgi:hypothetical protein
MASLTISELYHNTHYCELCKQYNYVSGVLASYLDRGHTHTDILLWTSIVGGIILFLLCPCTLKRFTIPALHIDSHMSSSLGFHNLDYHASSLLGFHNNNVDTRKTLSFRPSNTDSHTSSSLGPSNLSSKNATSVNSAAVDLLNLVEAPSWQPESLKPIDLWYYEDCLIDNTRQQETETSLQKQTGID